MMMMCGLCAVSCTKQELADESDKREVAILLHWSGKEPPPGMEFRFYSAEEKAYLLEQAETSPQGYVGMLPAGRCRVLACNTGTTGITFSDMEDYHGATATATPTGMAGAQGMQLIAQPSALYAGTMGSDLELFQTDAVKVSIVPRQLTRHLWLTLRLKDLPEITLIEGLLPGLYPSVWLANGQPTETAVAKAPQTATAFAGSVAQGSVRAKLSFFGILNPEGGGTYRNEMPVTLRKRSGEEETVIVDLTRVLTDLAAQGQGGFGFESEDEIEISVEPTPAGLLSRVVSLTRSGRGEGEITYIIY